MRVSQELLMGNILLPVIEPRTFAEHFDIIPYHLKETPYGSYCLISKQAAPQMGALERYALRGQNDKI